MPRKRVANMRVISPLSDTRKRTDGKPPLVSVAPPSKPNDTSIRFGSNNFHTASGVSLPGGTAHPVSFLLDPILAFEGEGNAAGQRTFGQPSELVTVTKWKRQFAFAGKSCGISRTRLNLSLTIPV